MISKRRLLVVAALSVPLGCTFFESKVRVYVDNGGGAEVQVSVDDAAAVTVPAPGYVVNYHASGWSVPTFDTRAGDTLRATTLLKPDPWVAGSFDEVLDETPPKSVRKKRGNLDPVHIRLCRIALPDYNRLAAAQAAYLKALQSKPNELPSLDGDTEATLQRVLSACP